MRPRPAPRRPHGGTKSNIVTTIRLPNNCTIIKSYHHTHAKWKAEKHLWPLWLCSICKRVASSSFVAVTLNHNIIIFFSIQYYHHILPHTIVSSYSSAYNSIIIFLLWDITNFQIECNDQKTELPQKQYQSETFEAIDDLCKQSKQISWNLFNPVNKPSR